MNNQRIDRVNEEVKRHVDAILREELRDPRIKGTFSVTRAEVTRDLRYAKIYISVLNDEDRDGMMDALKKAAGLVRSRLGKRMIIRYAPEILFEADKNIAYGIHIADVLRKVQAEESPHDNG
ncbi:MAG: 30S ribosome-binding factor RbfA [Bacillota bacterium]